MSETNSDLFSDDGDTIAAIQRGEIIGGAYDSRSEKVVPVTLRWLELDGPAAQDYDLGEYVAEDGSALALLARIHPGRRTRAWLLTELAREEGYTETEVPISGAGAGTITKHGENGLVADYPFGHEGDDEQPHVIMNPGDTFLFSADADQVIGAMVLSCLTIKFKPAYETIVAPSTSEERL